MSAASKVVLRVRAYGQRGIEFALSGPKSYEKRGSFTWWSTTILFISSGVVLSTVEWGVSSSYRVLSGLLLAALAAFIFQVTGKVIVEDQICGVAVNEAITFSNVVYSLVLMIETQSDMVLPFEV
ncbi:hypothetical protein PInf_006953 [Phytophthora infestans]|nr:hypothetical protein PInf_006953 [Phytophthora infestans]